jgi:uncharacterized protein YkwD
MPSRSDLDAVRAAVLCLIDRERARRGEPALRANTRLARAAQAHAASMGRDGYFNHVGPGGDTPVSRIRAAGYLAGARLGWAIAENIAWATGSLATPRAIVAAWMASPRHRANILDRRFRDTAVGVWPRVPYALSGGARGGMYTEDFGAIDH